MKRVMSMASFLITTTLVVLAFLLVGVRFLGISPYTIISGSMEAQYPVGSLVYVKKIDVGEIVVDDVITYVLNEEGIVSTHRVVEIDEVKQNFITKGDSNNSIDPVPVHFNNYLGKVIFSIPYLGYLSVFLKSTYGMILLGVILIVLILNSLSDTQMNKSNK